MGGMLEGVVEEAEEVKKGFAGLIGGCPENRFGLRADVLLQSEEAGGQSRVFKKVATSSF